MRYVLVALGALLLGFVLSALARPQNSVTPVVSWGFTDFGGDPDRQELLVEGTWKGDAVEWPVNVVHVQCLLKETVCISHEARVKHGMTLEMVEDYYNVKSVDAAKIVAEGTSVDACFHETLTLDRKAKAVWLVGTRNSNEGSCSKWGTTPRTMVLSQ